MVPTLLGLILFGIGLWLLFGKSIEAMIAFCFGCTLLGGGAVAILTSLGGASIPPAYMGLLFALLRISLPGAHQGRALRDGFTANIFFLMFAIYGIVAAFTMPRIFAGHINVVPLKPMGLRGLFGTAPLAFSSQNITASMNLVATSLYAIVAYVGCRQPRGAVIVVKAAVVVTLIHVFLGVSASLLATTPYSLFINFFRNGSYYQYSQGIAGFARITGVWPEPSAYAGYGFFWFIFACECWLRNIMPRRTGWAAALMGLVLLVSTSSTAYAGLAAYAVFFLLRIILFPQSLRFSKAATIIAAIMMAIILICALILLKPSIASLIGKILSALTIEKGASESGLQRAFWAKQGLDVFFATKGLGVGAGSFRSSSIITAILGSTGIIGSAAFLMYLAQVFKPGRMSTYVSRGHGVEDVGAAAGWTVLMSLFPLGVSWPTPDPGYVFGIFCGVALALRRSQPVKVDHEQPFIRRSADRRTPAAFASP
jgi:hypothetical protein